MVPGCGISLAVILLATHAGYGQQLSAPLENAAQCGPEGRLEVDLYGSIRASLDWTSSEFECRGMPRPNGRGARLHFAGTADLAGNKRRIAINISLPELKRGQTAHETAVIVTIAEEDSGRFFSSNEASSCLGDIGAQTPSTHGGRDEYVISGVVYCVAALAELNGAGDVSLTDLRFSGELDWRVPE